MLVLLVHCVASCRPSRTMEPRIRVVRCSVRLLPNGLGVAYPEIVNRGSEDTLVSVDSTQVQQVRIHETELDGDVVRMREPRGGVRIGASSAVQFAPGGRHLMLRGVKSSTVNPLSLTFHFKRAGSITAKAELAPSGP